MKVQDLFEVHGKSRQQQFDFERMLAGAISRDEYDKKWKLGRYKPKDNSKNLDGPGGIYKNLVKRIGEGTEGASHKLFVGDSYGSGFNRKAVKKGEMLTRKNGDEAEFIGVTDDGKSILAMQKGRQVRISLKDIGGKVLQAGQKADKAFFEDV